MSEADISPLAKRLAEENNVEWRRLHGSGAEGKVVERDVLEYLARVMSGQEDLDPTPEPLPEGMEEWPEEDIAAYRRGARERAEAASHQEPLAGGHAASEPDDEIDEDIFLFEDDDFELDEEEAAVTPPDVFAASPVEAGDEDEDLFLDLPSSKREEAPAADRERDIGSMAFDLDEPEPIRGGGAAVERRDVRDLEFIGGHVMDERERSAQVEAKAVVQAETEIEVQIGAGIAAESTRAGGPGEEPTRIAHRAAAEVTRAPEEIPVVRYGHLLRRHLDLTAVKNAQAALALELDRREPLALSGFLLRAASKALRAHPLGAGGVTLATVEDGLAYHHVADPAGTRFRDLVDAIYRDAGTSDVPDGTALVVVDLSALELDEAVLNVGVPVLALGRVLYDDEAGDVHGTLSLSGDVPPDAGGRILAVVADLLAAPVRLVV